MRNIKTLKTIKTYKIYIKTLTRVYSCELDLKNAKTQGKDSVNSAYVNIHKYSTVRSMNKTSLSQEIIVCPLLGGGEELSWDRKQKGAILNARNLNSANERSGNLRGLRKFKRENIFEDQKHSRRRISRRWPIQKLSQNIIRIYMYKNCITKICFIPTSCFLSLPII